MEPVCERRLTVDGRPDMYGSSIAYAGTESDPHWLWWSLESHFSWLRMRGLQGCAKEFYRAFKRIVAQDVSTDSYILRSATAPCGCILPICTTRALISSMWNMVDCAKSHDLAKACTTSLIAAANTIAPHITEGLSVINVLGVAATMRVSAMRAAHGFAEVMLKLHPHVLMSISASWDQMRRSELIHGSLVSPSHTLQDLIRFVISLKKWRAVRRQHPLCVAAMSWLTEVRQGIVEWIANGMDHYTLHEYHKHHRVDKPPPSHTPTKRVRLHPDAVWNMLHTSETTSSSLSQVIQIRSVDDDCGGAVRNGSR